MNDQTAALTARLEREIHGLSAEQADEIIRQAQAEALDEVKALLRETMVSAMLGSVLGRLAAGPDSLPGTPSPHPETGWGEGVPGRESGPAVEPSQDDDLRREIESIRRQIAENERLLREAGPEPVPGLETSEVSKTSEVSDQGLGCYLYAVVGAEDDGLADDLPDEGIEPTHPVYRVRHGDLRAIVSQVPLSEFGQEELEKRLDDLEWVETGVYAHQRVLDALVTRGALVPMRFCTIYRSEDRLQQALSEHYDEFSAALARLKGKQEWGVKGYCDTKTLAEKVEDIDPSVKERRDELSQKSGGAAYFQKKKLDEAVQARAVQISDEKAQWCHDRLSACCVQATLGSLQQKAGEDDQGDIILNGAYLVADEQWVAFSAELQSLNAELGPLGFRLELTGPWPPYNFTAVESGGEAHEPDRSD